LKTRIKNYFTFTKSERIGLFILLSILSIVLVIPGLFSNSGKPLPSQDNLYKAEVEEFLRSENPKEDGFREHGDNNFSSYPHSDATSGKYNKFRPHAFDPNSCSLEEWVNMGFTEKQAATIINYRNKGGLFKVKEDFRKLYVVDDETYATFEPYIVIKDKESKSSQGYASVNTGNTVNENGNSSIAASKKQVIVELNGADSLELISIRGIGPVFASRILKYRNKLGGFARTEQLMEVYGIDSTRYPEIAPQVTIDAAKIKTININKATINELRKHPYLDYYLAKAIIDRRLQKGTFISVDEIKEIMKKKPGLFEKISPYLVTAP